MGLMDDILSELSEEEINERNRKKVTENKDWTIYITPETKMMQKDLNEYTDDGICIGDFYHILFGENKNDGSRTYIAFEKKSGRPVLEINNPYSDYPVKKMVLESWVRDDLDIVNMAKMVKR